MHNQHGEVQEVAPPSTSASSGGAGPSKPRSRHGRPLSMLDESDADTEEGEGEQPVGEEQRAATELELELGLEVERAGEGSSRDERDGAAMVDGGARCCRDRASLKGPLKGPLKGRLTLASTLAPAAPPPGYSFVEKCPPLSTPEEEGSIVGQPILYAFDDAQRSGWFLGHVLRRGAPAQDLRKTPTANFVVKYSRKATGGHLEGTVACELSEAVYGADMWWVLLRADAHIAPPTSQSSSGGVLRQSSGAGASHHGARRPLPPPDRPSRKRAQAVAFKAGPAPPPRLLAAVARSGTVGPGELGEL